MHDVHIVMRQTEGMHQYASDPAVRIPTDQQGEGLCISMHRLMQPSPTLHSSLYPQPQSDDYCEYERHD